LGGFECINALIAMAKRLSIVLNAMGQESGLWDFLPATAKNTQERESSLVLSAAGQALFQHRHNQTEPLPAIPVSFQSRCRRWGGSHGRSGGVADRPR
jgi:hypothetical protein